MDTKPGINVCVAVACLLIFCDVRVSLPSVEELSSYLRLNINGVIVGSYRYIGPSGISIDGLSDGFSLDGTYGSNARL